MNQMNILEKSIILTTWKKYICKELLNLFIKNGGINEKNLIKAISILLIMG